MKLHTQGQAAVLEKVLHCGPTTAQLIDTRNSGAHAQDVTVMKNAGDLVWEKMLPDLADDSPRFAILRIDPKTNATSLMIEFPSALHIPKHTHEKSETHIILGGSHVFEETDSGKRFDVREHGYIYMPGKFMHEAWVPAGSKAVIILEDGWKVDWLDGPPNRTDLGKGQPDV